MKAPVRWLDEPGALPDELLASMQAYRELGPSERELAQMRVRLQGRAPLRGWKLVPVIGALLATGVWLTRPNEVVRIAPPAVPVVVQAPAFVAPAIVDEPAPAVQAKPRVRRRVQPVVAPAIVDPAAELAILQRARRALAAAPQTSLALAEEHARSYPQGAFAQERELIAIEALAGTDRPAAIARARAFAAQYPRSAHLERIEKLLGDR